MMGVANGCFVESVAFLDRWHERFGGEAWARMLQWGAKEEEEVVAGHAVAVCEAKGKLWCWDINFGWKPVPAESAQREKVETVATSILARYPKISAYFPNYRFDFPQAPADAIAVARTSSPNETPSPAARPISAPRVSAARRLTLTVAASVTRFASSASNAR